MLGIARQTEVDMRFVVVEISDAFDEVLLPRMKKVIYAKDWKGGQPMDRLGQACLVKYLRLESYEDALNNLEFRELETGHGTAAERAALEHEYTLKYMLNTETRGSQSLLNVDAFADPTAYRLKVKSTGSDEYSVKTVDLLETFNSVLGVRVEHIATPQTFSAEFRREPDPELPDDQHTRLVIDGRIRQDADGPWWFRKVEGWIPKDFKNPNNGDREKVLIVWRKCPKLIEMGPEGLEYDNAVLDA